jgi:hypothetical protein
MVAPVAVSAHLNILEIGIGRLAHVSADKRSGRAGRPQFLVGEVARSDRGSDFLDGCSLRSR